jgi:release factor glutamine methyltransferase
VTTTRETWIRGAERLAAAGIDSARLDARVLLAHAMNLATGETASSREPSAEESARYEELLSRRAAREPVAYITGEREFWSLSFAVGAGVLIPRPETETLLEEAARHFPDHGEALKVLDLGTGSGCLLIAFLRDYPQARGVGIDLSPVALSWARRNCEKLDVASRCIWLEGGWDVARDETFDLIFSNPPYLALGDAVGLAPEIAHHEPGDALFAGPDGLDSYRSLAPIIAHNLKPGGRAFLEIGVGQSDAVCDILDRYGLEIVDVKADLADTPRCIGVGLNPGIPGPAPEKTVGNERPSR